MFYDIHKISGRIKNAYNINTVNLWYVVNLFYQEFDHKKLKNQISKMLNSEGDYVYV